MNRFICLYLILSIGATGARLLQGAPMVDGGDVGTFPTLPDWGEVCVASDVRGGPELFYPVISSIEKGARVRLHELSKPDGSWVSIAVAQWMPLKNLCSWN